MTTWILLRGLTRDSHHWGRFAREFERAIGDPVHCIDLPGNGLRCREFSPTTIGGLLADCRTSLAAMPGTYPIRLLALSLGAMVATDVASASGVVRAGDVCARSRSQRYWATLVS